ncbi:MAG TPA: hypothetical protein VG675_17490 [Bryobacteraceae bacterium]|nr:hypothetical protein [Bryobacteraceae bacterium]
MSASFSWRKTTAKDLAECLQLRPEKRGAENIDNQRATEAWFQLFELTYASKSALVEMHRQGNVEIVGFGFSAFVKESFAESEVSGPRPGLNGRIIESIDRGRPVIASYREVRDANTRGTLQQVILETCWKDGCLDAAQVDEVRILLGRAYQEIHAGYSIARVLAELVGELDFWHVRGHRSFQIVSRFEAYRLANPETCWNADRALAMVTRENMRVDPGSIAAGVFLHRQRPQFAFTLCEQELLEMALDGLDDASAAKALFVSVPAIKRRWANIFQRVATVNPDICAWAGDGVRSIQKRHRVLAYVRSHPEELRPFDFSERENTAIAGSRFASEGR